MIPARPNAILRYADKQQDNFHAFNLPSSPPCNLSHKEAVCIHLQEYIDVGVNNNIHFVSIPERSHPDRGRRVAVEVVGCADNMLVKEGSAGDVVVEEEGSTDALD